MSRNVAYFVIYWMSTAIFGENIPLNTTQEVTVKCKERIVLQCNVSSQESVLVLDMTWGNACTHSTPSPQCHYMENKSLTYTIPSAKPIDAQMYTCNLQANNGHGKAQSTVKVGDCKGQVLSNIQAKHVQCSFLGVYPKGIVHWFHGNVNMTHLALPPFPNSTIAGNTDGLFNISSTLPIQNGVHRYNCSLWIPAKNGYLTSHVMTNGQCSLNKNKLSSILLVLGFILSQGFKNIWEM